MRLRPVDLGLAALAALLVAFYAWTAATSASLAPGDHLVDNYNAQTDALLAGHTYLATKPPAGLLALPDPYLPALNQPFRFAMADLPDPSLYKGRFYTYWGLTPIVLAFAPFRLLGVGKLAPAAAALLFAIGALLATLALLRVLVRRYAPKAPTWMVLAAAAFVGAGNLAPWLLRHPTVYEVAIAAGLCFLALAALLLVTAGASRIRLAGSSLCLGLAVGARPNLALAAVAFLAVLYLRRGRPGRALLATALLGPLAACAAVIGTYNAIRFGSPLEFGQRYQIGGFDLYHDAFLSASFIPPNLYWFLVAPAALRLQFPFFWLGPPPNFPGHVAPPYVEYDPTGGILATQPILLLLALLPVAWRLRSTRWAMGGPVALAAVLVAFVVVYSPGASERYEADFLTLALVPAVLVWLALWRRRGVRIAGLALGAFGTLVATATSLTGSTGAMRTQSPQTYRALVGFFDPLPTIASQLANRPLIASVGEDPHFPPQRLNRVDLGGIGFESGSNVRMLRVYAPHDETATVSAEVYPRGVGPAGTRFHLLAGTATSPTGGRLQRVRVPLRRGRNDFAIGVKPDPALPLAPDDPLLGALVDLRDVQVR